MKENIRTLAKLSWVELKLFMREPFTMVFTFALPLLFVLVMGGVFGNEADPEIYRGIGAMNYYISAYIALTIASIGLVTLPVHLTSYRERGVLRRLRASSVSVWLVLGSQVMVSFVIAAIGSVIVILASRFTYDARLPEMTGLVVLAFIIAVLSFAALGVLLGAVLPNTRAAQGLGLILFFVVLILGGAGPPREVLNSAMQLIGDATPLRHAIIMLQDPWLGFGWNTSEFLVVAGITVVSTLLSVRFFRWD
jgi:ABC-2 type transport system permease protein